MNGAGVGMANSMDAVRLPLPHLEHRADAARVIAHLRRNGPETIHDLLHDDELADWSTERVEDAVVDAWAQTLIFVDRQDRLVPL